MRHRLSESELKLLREVLSHSEPDLLTQLDEAGLYSLTREQLDAIGDALFMEFMSTGLNDNFEPTQRGKQLDMIMYYLDQKD
jgi:hypothetical protein